MDAVQEVHSLVLKADVLKRMYGMKYVIIIIISVELLSEMFLYEVSKFLK
jgi:hypothetical protein